MQALKLVSTENLSHEDWLSYRNQGITGSRIASIMGKNPWDSPLSIYLEMTGRKPPKEQNDAMYFGTVLEDFIATEFSKRTGMKIKKIDAILQHPTYEFLLANVDRLIDEEEPGILECKNVSEYSKDQWLTGCPEHYYMQLQWYLGITGLKYGHICALVGGNKFIHHRYNRDEALIEEMFEKATDFWYLHIEPRIPPESNHQDGDLLSSMYPVSTTEVLNLTDEDESLITDLLASRRALKTAQEQEELSKNRLKERMKEAEMLTYEGEIICTWKTNKKGSRVFNVLVKESE